MPADGGAHVVVAHVDGEQAEGGQVAGVARHEHARQTEHVHQPARGSEPDPPKVAIVKSRTSSPRLTVTWRSALAWFQAEISRMPVAGRSSSSRAGRQGPRSAARSVDVERDLAAEQVRRDPAQDEVRVGDRRLCPRRGRSRAAQVGAGRAGPDLERPLQGHQAIGPATRADGDDIDHRDLARVAADGALGGERRLAVDYDGDVGRRAAAITGDHPVEARRRLRPMAAPRPPAAGPESTVVIGWCTTSSADSTPPFDFIT